MKKIIISQKDGTTCAAILAGDELDAFYTAQDDNPQLVGNIYKRLLSTLGAIKMFSFRLRKNYQSGKAS